MGCVIISYRGHYQLPRKGTSGHFNHLLWSTGIALQPHVWNTKVKIQLPVTIKPAFPASVFPEIVLHSRIEYQLYGPQRKERDLILEPGNW